MQRLLSLRYHDHPRALREIAGLTRHLPPAVSNRLDLLLAFSPAPELGLYYFSRLREAHPERFEYLTRSTAGLRHLVAVFTHSRFLSEEVLEHPDWAATVLDPAGLLHPIAPEALRARLEAALPAGRPDPLHLAKFRRRQMLRIVVRDVLGMATLPSITSELSTLADVLVEAAYDRISAGLVARYGVPRSEKDSSEAHFTVIALGKLGGQELNYSSDIDLMFLYSDPGHTSGPRVITNQEFFTRAANELTALLSTFTAEGLCYRVDLRLRPDGSLGEVCISLDGARKYYGRRARDWELQMLIKARVAAGYRPSGNALLNFVEPRTYSTTLDFSAVEQLSLTRERMNEKLSARQMRKGISAKLRERPGAIDVKLDRGGIRDIEFLVQCLQRLYGGAEPWVRHGGTMHALSRLQDKGFLSGAEYGKLAAAYQFLRHLEHRLQFEDDLQTHTLPSDPEALDLLARRMPGGGGTAAWLLDELRGHYRQVSELYNRFVHSRLDYAPLRYTGQSRGSRSSLAVQALDHRAPVLAAALERVRPQSNNRSFEHFLERLSAEPSRLEELNTDPALAGCTVELFEHSSHFAGELIRNPELVDEIKRSSISLREDGPVPADASELRRWYRREMLRIQTESVCASVPIFDTLSRTSELADTVIARAYAISIEETRRSHPPEDPDYVPVNQLFVVALGRLGVREFDLASDADLVFVLADRDAAELPFWTRVAERMVDMITAYTGSGVLYAVDTRLRPNGGAGPLVQTESAVTEYFDKRAEAWEGITYMKSRVAAGDAARAETFLHQLQEVDWRRYGQSGRSRSDLYQMRMRLEREQGAAHPLKAGRGGYYDIDFLLMYLRLKSAGIFFRVLNTPARIEVLESMGHLDRPSAEFLLEAATFFRALDHGLRVFSGHAEEKLPKAAAHREILEALVKRWSPVPLSELERIRSRTRALFDRQFG